MRQRVHGVHTLSADMSTRALFLSRCYCVVVAASAAAVAVGGADTTSAASSAYDAITSGVASGYPRVDDIMSRLQLLSDDAFPIAVADDQCFIAGAIVTSHGDGGSGARAPTDPQGRLVVFGHEGPLVGFVKGDDDPASYLNVEKLVGNAVKWLVDRNDEDGIRYVIDVGFPADFGTQLVAAHDGDGTASTTAFNKDDELSPATDVLVLNFQQDFDEDLAATIVTFTKAGGAVLGGGHAWWWGYNNEDPYLNHDANRFLVPLGIGLDSSAIYLQDHSYDHIPTTLPGGDRNIMSVPRALKALIDDMDDKIVLKGKEKTLALTIANDAVSFLPTSASLELWSLMHELTASLVETGVVDFPVDNDGFAKFTLAVFEAQEQKLPAKDVVASVWANSVCPHCRVKDDSVHVDDFELVVSGTYTGRSLRFTYSDPGADVWRSLGLYVAPGQAATVKTSTLETCVSLRVGSHSDPLHHKDKLERPPKIDRVFSLTPSEEEGGKYKGTTIVNNAHGGLLYLTVARGCTAGDVTVSVSGAYEAPRFVAGVTTKKEWEAAIKNPAAPWAELESVDNLIITLLSSDAQGVSDPDSVMSFWADVIKVDRALGGESVVSRAERFVLDIQVGWGYMHAGYPIGMPLYSEAGVYMTDGTVCDSEWVGTEVNGWGPFHELGHQFQDEDWVVHDTSEANVNLFSLVVAEKLCGKARDTGHPARKPKEKMKRWEAWEATASDSLDFSVWVALDFFMELESILGWEGYAAVFALYDESDRVEIEERFELPRCSPCTIADADAHVKPEYYSDEAKHDLLMVRSAFVAARDGRGDDDAKRRAKRVVDLWKKWRLPASRQALDSVLDSLSKKSCASKMREALADVCRPDCYPGSKKDAKTRGLKKCKKRQPLYGKACSKTSTCADFVTVSVKDKKGMKCVKKELGKKAFMSLKKEMKGLDRHCSKRKKKKTKKTKKELKKTAGN